MHRAAAEKFIAVGPLIVNSWAKSANAIAGKYVIFGLERNGGIIFAIINQTAAIKSDEANAPMKYPSNAEFINTPWVLTAVIWKAILMR